jgi:hypothetical protein
VAAVARLSVLVNRARQSRAPIARANRAAEWELRYWSTP